MAASPFITVLLLGILLCIQALQQQQQQESPHGRRSRRDRSSRAERRAALRNPMDNMAEERLAQVEAKIEGEVADKLLTMQDGMQRLERMMNAMAEKMAGVMETKDIANDDSDALLEASKTREQFTSAPCQYKYQYQFEQESPQPSGHHQRVVKLESELARLQEKVSALDQRLQNNNNAQAMDGVVETLTERLSSSEEYIKSLVLNATKFLHETSLSMMNDTKGKCLAESKSQVAAFDASIFRVEQLSKELEMRMSAVEVKVDTTTSVLAELLQSARAWCDDGQRRTEDLGNSSTVRMGDPCSKSAECKSTDNAECRYEKCQCVLGYHFYPGPDTCVERCPAGYGNGYYKVLGKAISGHNLRCTYPGSEAACYSLCSQDSRCSTFDWSQTRGACCTQDVTWLQYPGDGYSDPTWSHCQMNCA